MEARIFNATLEELGLGQADLGRLLGVTPRGVNLWAKGDRAIPGPVEAYLRLFQMLPQNLRLIEIQRLKDRGTNMRDGIFGVTFKAGHGAGIGVLIFEEGRVYGTDSEGARFDGHYIFREEANRADVVIKATFPPNVMTVFGIANPYEWAIDVATSFDPSQNNSALQVTTSLGDPLEAQLKYLRALPNAA